MNDKDLTQTIQAMAIRAEKLPLHKQIQLRETLEANQGIDPDTINWLILMHEHSDDNGNITNQTLANIINKSQPAARTTS